MDAQRRRLTVSNCAPGTTIKGGSTAEPGTLTDLGLETLDNHEKRVVAIYSKTDGDMRKKRSYAEKDKEICGKTESKKSSSVNDADRKELENWVKTDMKVFFACKKGLKPESPNQDSYTLLVVEGEYAVYGVFDGHGPAGHDVSNFARKEIVRIFVNHPKRLSGESIEEAFIDAFELTQELIQQEKSFDSNTSGSTCTMAYHNFKTDELTIAHVGDSRGVLRSPKESIPLTEDHKPNLPKEKQRIEDKGGRVVFDGYYNYRVFAKAGMYPGLNMSRALGDVIAHNEAGLCATPDIKVVKLKDWRPAEVTLLLCSDGVWEFIQNAEAMKVIHDDGGKPSQDTCEALAKKSWEMWMQDSDNEISDDITVMVVCL